MTLLQKFLPLLSQLSDYGREQLRGDLSAGLSEELGEDQFFFEVHDAVEAAEAQVDEETERAAAEEPAPSS